MALSLLLNMLLGAVILAGAVTGEAAASGIQTRPATGAIEVITGSSRWVLSATTFSVIQSGSVNGQERLRAGKASVQLNGSRLLFGAPSQVQSGEDWVELRGWVDQQKALWYVARYQFFAGQPYLRLLLTLTDRHDTSPGPQSSRYWNDRVVSNWNVEIGAPAGRPALVTQHNSYSFSSPGEPWVDVVGVTGAPYQWAASVAQLDASRFQLAHATGDGANQIVWHPLYEGQAEITALYTGFAGGHQYKAARAVTYEVVDATGKTHSKVVDQQAAHGAPLGTFALSKQSVVRLKATGLEGKDTVIAGPLRIAPTGGDRAFEVRLGARHDGVLTDGPLTLAIKDFWQHHPISLFRTEHTVGWAAIRRPELLAGGMGLTVEAMISMDGPAAPVTAALYAPPRRELPAWVHPIEGSLAHGPVAARYDALLKRFAERYPAHLEQTDSFGWRNWGDYQIGVSYGSRSGPVEDWANLQYDLPYGLLLAWLRTGDPRLWRLAQASVRHLMDIDLVKFAPLEEKLNGLVYRKGETPKSRSHVAEPLVEQGFAFRSLLLYHALTGEQWARDLAKQNIDRLTYYQVTRPHRMLRGDRTTSWTLRGILAGAQHFAGDRTYDYKAIADAAVGQLVEYYRAHGRLPGVQPVWQGQMVEGLALYHRVTNRPDVAEAIVGHVRYLVTEATRRRAGGGYEFLYCYDPGRKGCSTPEWTREHNYAFLWLGSIAYAHRLSGDPFFARWADDLFTYAESKQLDRSDGRTWTSALGFPHFYLEGK